jgi:sirohydrochlorin cobaltochelatase
MKAIIFFGHGARDIRWREPFDRLLTLWQDTHPNIPAKLAFLELMSPQLLECVSDLNHQGITDVQIIPVFFGQGGHLRNDFPVLLEECQSKFPNMKLSRSSAVGESDEVLNSIINFSIKALQ